jgi:glycerol-3-phosphate dehydrogenase
VTVRQALGLSSGRASDAKLGRTRRLFFMTPWKDCTAIGSSHLPYKGDPRQYRFSERDIVEFLGEINDCFSLSLSREDIHYCYAGLTPADDDAPEETSRSRKDDLVDHDHDHGIAGLISVVGAKYTTSRHVAEKAVDLVFRKLGRAVPICTASSTALPGAREFDASRLEIGADPRGLDVETQLKATYGSLWSEVLRHHPQDETLDERTCFHAQCRYAVEHEMAVTLRDVLLGRTDRAARGVLTSEDVAWCVEMLSERLAWDDARRRKETEQLFELLNRHGQQLDRAERSCTIEDGT